MLSHSLAADVCFFSESDFKSFPMKLVYKFSTGCVMRWKQGLEVVVINSWNKQLVPIEHVLVLLGLQDVFLAFFFSREEKIKSQLYSVAACHALWKTFPITLLPSMHSTCSVVFLQFMWQRNVLEWSCKAAVPWERDRLPLVLARATSLLPAVLLTLRPLTSTLSSLFCVQGFVSTIWFTSWVRSLGEDKNYYTSLDCNVIVYFFSD